MADFGGGPAISMITTLDGTTYELKDAAARASIKTYTANTSKLVTTTVPNMTSAGSAATATVANGVLTITNGTAPTLGTAITVATGGLASNGGGDTVATGITAS